MKDLPLNQILCGDCVEVLKDFPDNSIDLVVTDPPYGLSFMGKDWDKALPSREAFTEIIRVLKPGALAFVMSSPRQDLLWRMLALLEGVGFELTQSYIDWIYKTGFPKAYDVSKGIDKKLGVINERKTIGHYQIPSDSEAGNAGKSYSDMPIDGNVYQDPHRDTRKASITEPVSEDAKIWEGWKSQTGLKPAHEPILMVNKPFSEKTIVDNVLKWGTGAINVDSCRIPITRGDEPLSHRGVQKNKNVYGDFAESYDYEGREYSSMGRFPANLLVSDKALDTGKLSKSGTLESHHEINSSKTRNIYGEYQDQPPEEHTTYGDVGDQSRYFDLDAWAKHNGFLDVAKPSREERSFGLWDMPKGAPPGSKRSKPAEGRKNPLGKPRANYHPTVKPIKLMAYLIELGCPPDGVVLDPFVGSGTTCIAAKRLVRKYVGIEINPEYVALAQARIRAYPVPFDWFTNNEGSK